MVTRRQFGLGLGVATLATTASGRRAAVAQAASGPWAEELGCRFAEIETRCGGRLGVGVLDTGSGRAAGHRGDERFPVCSTYKALGAAAVLARVDRGEERLDRLVRFGAEDLLPYSPGTKAYAGGGGMALAAVCEAAVTLSDNTAGNLVFDAVGGPAGLTAYLRGIGDGVTRLDRTEPTLNEVPPGDLRDTTSPAAMAATLGRLLFGQALSPASSAQLAAWLVECRTGDARLRAGVPPGWRVGDKTGTNDQGTANDVGVLWPPGRAPVVVTAFVTAPHAPADARNAAIADVARAVLLALEA